MSHPSVFDGNYMADVKMKVFIDHTYNAFQDSKGSLEAPTGSCNNSLSSNYSSSARAPSPKLEDHVKVEDNSEMCSDLNMLNAEPDTSYYEKTLHNAPENCISPHNVENHSASCSNQHIGASEVQCTLAKNVYSSDKIFSSCDDCKKPIKMEPEEYIEDPMGNNIEGLHDMAQNNYAVHDNAQSGPEINVSTKIEVDYESCNNVQASNYNLCTSVHFANERTEESPLSVVTRKVKTLKSRATYCKERSFRSNHGNASKSHKNRKHHHATNSEEKSFSCECCEKAFKSSWELRRHCKFHSEERTFFCKQCGKAFKTQCKLKEHLITHSGERSFACEHCGKTFKRSSNLKLHAIIHSEERPFSCELCGKTFKIRCKLKQHCITHSEERSFTCKHCLKTFKRSSDLKMHALLHSEVRPFTCEHCEKSFTNTSNLNSHLIVAHSEERPFSCEQCGKAFKTHWKLKEHLITHSEERSFTCEHCGKKFKRNSALKRHVTIHSEVRPFTCEHCGKSFTNSSTSCLTTQSEERHFSCEQCEKVFKLHG